MPLNQNLLFAVRTALALSLVLLPASWTWAQGGVVRFGQIVPLSGALANVGKEISAATQAAFDQHNAGGQPKVELMLEDDANNPERSKALVAAVADRSGALLSCFGAVGCVAQMEAAQLAGLPLIGPISGVAQLRGRQADHVFAVRASATQELSKLLEFGKTMSVSSVAVLVQDDGFGQGYWAELKELLKRTNIQVKTVVILSTQSPNYAQAVTELTAQSTQPAQATQALILLANAAHSSAILNAWRERASLPLVMNLSGQANALFSSHLKGYGGAVTFVTVTPSPWESKLQIQRDYQRAMAAAGLKTYSYLSFEAYINARVAIEAAKGARTNSSKALSKILATKVFDISGMTWRFSERAAPRYTDLSILSSDGTFKH